MCEVKGRGKSLILNVVEAKETTFEERIEATQFHTENGNQPEID